jgi:hypothetical protein
MSVKVKKPHVYSVLFMRDDSGVTRFRMRALWLKLLILLFILMTLAAGAGAWAAHYYWQRYEFHKEEARGLDGELKESQRQLDRLVNLEKFLEAHDPVLLRTIMSSVAVPGNGTDPGEYAGSVAPQDDPPATTPDGGNGDGDAATQGPEAGQNGGAGSAGGNANPSESGPEVSPPHPVTLSNIQVRPSSSRIYVAFDLGNLDSSQPLSGRVSLSLVDGGGKVTPIGNASSESGLRFTQIVRYKPISATIPLPQGTAMADIAAVRVNVETEGNPPFAQILPMPAQ